MIERLKEKTFSGIKWNSISMGATTLIRLGTLIVLCRLLDPADFGLMGMIMAVIGLAEAFGDAGLSHALIQRQDVPRSHLSSLFWCNIAGGVVFFVLIIAGKSFIAQFFREPRLVEYLSWAALLFP